MNAVWERCSAGRLQPRAPGRAMKNRTPERYDSPELFRQGDRLFMAARRDPEGIFGPRRGLVCLLGQNQTDGPV